MLGCAPPPSQERGAAPQPFPITAVLTMGLAGAGSRHAEPSSAHAVAGHVLLRLEEYDVELGGEEAAEDHSAAEAHRDAHGGGLDLETGVGVRRSGHQPSAPSGAG